MKLQKLFLAIAAIAMMGATFSALANKNNKDKEVKFTVKVENVSSKDLQTASDGSKWPFALSPGFWAVHMQEVRFFNENKVMGPNGLEMQAEDGNPSGMVDFLMGHHNGMQHGVFNTPNGGETPGPIGPGGNGNLEVYRARSGYSGADIAEYGQPGSNGLTLDPQGRLTINQHGNRRVIRLEKDGSETVLADKYEGKRLNSPNDLVYRSDGTLFFTDPPFGLPKFFTDPRKELNFSGVYSLYKNKLQLVSKDFTGPNGIAFSPDEKYLYVGNWDEKKKIVHRYEVNADGTLRNGTVFFDMTNAKGEDALDGIKVDQAGNLYVSGPGGLWVLSPDGKHLGTIVAPKHIHNMAWGDEDGKTLYLCARSGLYKMHLNIAGVRPMEMAGN